MDVYVFLCSEVTPAADATLTAEDCKYQLKGVLVHAGTANNGHYYSFVKERAVDGADSAEADLRWFHVGARKLFCLCVLVLCRCFFVCVRTNMSVIACTSACDVYVCSSMTTSCLSLTNSTWRRSVLAD